MNKEIFKLSAIVEQDPLDDNLMSMVMGGAGGEFCFGQCNGQTVTCCKTRGCLEYEDIQPCLGGSALAA